MIKLEPENITMCLFTHWLNFRHVALLLTGHLLQIQETEVGFSFFKKRTWFLLCFNLMCLYYVH
jgi:hypothetical protein